MLEVADSNRRKYQCFNIVDLATGFQQLELLRGSHQREPWTPVSGDVPRGVSEMDRMGRFAKVRDGRSWNSQPRNLHELFDGEGEWM